MSDFSFWHDNPAWLAALAALEKEAETNPDAAKLWRRIEPVKDCAMFVLRELVFEFGSGGYVETISPLWAMSLLALLEGCLPLPRRMLQ